MVANSNIEWTDHTFNPWIGCTKVSPGCEHCYAETWANRYGTVDWGKGNPRKLTSESNWQQPIKWNRQAEAEGRRYRVFCASLADVMDNEVPNAWRQSLWDLIRKTPHLDWLLLTKRIGNAKDMLPTPTPENIWLGATIVNQEEADRDIPKLLNTPANIRFLSMEPLLGHVDLDGRLRGIHWVIVGGESGKDARPMEPVWARAIRNRCVEKEVAFHFKQWGGVNKKAAGRELDGRTWDQLPSRESV